jgi:bifunctional UDP-N-acetylglucosamine pyrophosphorylase/glucosamine-1-phosphate N-acetyltransferase
MKKSKEIAFIILAAGKGTRMKNPLPKVLHKIGGETLISHVIKTAMQFGGAKIIPVLSPDMPEVAGEVLRINSNAKITHQVNQLGTGDAVKSAIPALSGNEDFVVILYGDTPFVEAQTIEKLITAIEANSKSGISLLGFEKSDENQYGRLVVSGDVVKKIVEFKDASDAEKAIKLCNSGVIAFKGNIIKEVVSKISNNNSKGEFYLTDAIEIAANMGFQCGLITCDEAEVMGINSQIERAEAEKILQNKLRKKHLENGVIIIAPETVFFSNETEIEAGATIHPNVVFLGKNKIASGVEIKSFSHIEGAEIGKNAVIGPFARIRPGSALAEDSHIGNFVEIKNSKIGKGSKANHLSYIGDSEIGTKTNIGAGVITCNYDGKNKHKTIIGDNVFVGSDTILVAPVKVGDNAIIGAATTVLKDVEPNSKIVDEKKRKEI